MKRNEFTSEQEQWLQALESGKYSQCKDKLWKELKPNKKSFCCLGIAHQLFDPSNINMNPCPLENQYSHGGVLGEELRKRMFFKGAEGDISPVIVFKGEYYHNLASMNDNGVNFKQIANMIRQKPWKVFTNFDNPELAEGRGVIYEAIHKTTKSNH